MIKRIFHPIGQGAYSSERHQDFNIVYDCGNWKKTKLSEKVVRQSFKMTDEIDILFISHFDSDHINRVETLKNHCAKIKIVVLPLLHEEEKKLISNIYLSIDESIVPIISNPEDFFDKETKIIYVRPTEKRKLNEEYNLEKLNKNQIIESRSIIKKDDDWIFVPFNFEYENRHAELVKLLRDNSIDYDKLKNDLIYSLSNRKKIRSIYDHLEGKINKNSMMVYSGPPSQDNLIRQIYRSSGFGFYIDPRKEDIKKRIACIYTGDGDLNTVKLSQEFQEYWDLVGTVQIPHHGDIKSYNNEDLVSNSYFCPISVGLDNSYGHPSSTVITDLYANNNIPITITERMQDFYFEIIK